MLSSMNSDEVPGLPTLFSPLSIISYLFALLIDLASQSSLGKPPLYGLIFY